MSGRNARRERAHRYAQSARHESVTVARLLGQGGYHNNVRLYDGPIIDALDADEQPHAILYHDSKGVEIRERGSAVSPDAGGVCVTTITDRRTLVLVGRDDGDRQLSLPHGDVVAGEYSTGILKHSLTIETGSLTYRLYVNSGYDEADLQTALDLIREFAPVQNAAEPTSRTPGAAADGGAARGGNSPAPGQGPADAGGGGAGTAGTAGDDGEMDPFERLERLEKLHSEGVLTDEEFQRKKRDLLDEI